MIWVYFEMTTDQKIKEREHKTQKDDWVSGIMEHIRYEYKKNFGGYC